MKRFPLLVLVMLIFSATPVTHAQSQCDSQTFQSILTRVGNTCADLRRNSVCYGNNAVSIAFWDDNQQTEFAAPGDLVPTDIVQRIETSRYVADDDLWGVALMRVQANIPNTLPGQAVTFLLMGDTQFVNQVAPDETALPLEPLMAVTLTPANLRSAPTTNALVRRSVPAGTELALIGRSVSGDWYELQTDTGLPTWVFADLVEVQDDPATLPVTWGPDAAPRYGPMQAFYFTTGIGNPQCREAPEAMVVEGPDDYTVRLTINDLDITLGSSMTVLTTEATDGRPVLVLVLKEGDLTVEVGGRGVSASSAGTTDTQVVVVETDDNGQVPPDAQLVPLEALDLEMLAEDVTDVCRAIDDADELGVTPCGFLATDTAATPALTAVELPPMPVQDGAGTGDNGDSGGEGNEGDGGVAPPSPPPLSESFPGDDDDDDDEYGYGAALPRDTITARQTNGLQQRREMLQGAAILFIVGMVGVFGIWGRRTEPDA